MRKPSSRGASGSCTTTAKDWCPGAPRLIREEVRGCRRRRCALWNLTEMVEIGKAHSQLANISAVVPRRIHSVYSSSPRLDLIELHSTLRSPD